MAAASELYRARVAVDMARSRLQQTAADAADAADAAEAELDADVAQHGGLAAALLVREATLATALCRVHEGILQCAADAMGSTPEPQEVLSRMRAASATESAAHAADDAARRALRRAREPGGDGGGGGGGNGCGGCGGNVRRPRAARSSAAA
jgi:hypothetical protein